MPYQSTITPVKDNPWATELCYVQFDYAKNRLYSLLNEESFVSISELKRTSDGYTQRFKNKYNDEINPERRYFDVKFKVFEVRGIEIVQSITIEGLQSYMNDIYSGFWNTEIKVNPVKDGILLSTNYMQDEVSVHIRSKGLSSPKYWIDIKNTKINMATFIQELNNKIVKEEEEVKAFKLMRATTSKNWSSTDNSVYKSHETKVQDYIRRALKDVDATTGTIKITVTRDTSAVFTAKVENSTAISTQDLENFLKNELGYKNVQMKGQYMKSVDEFNYSVKMTKETYMVKERGKKIEIQGTQPSAQVTDQLKKSVKTDNMNYSDAKFEVISTSLNSETPVEDVKSLEVKKKIDPKKVGIGVAVIAAGAAYYYFFQMN